MTAFPARRAALVVAVLLAAVTGACGSSTPTPSAVTPGCGATATFILANPGGLSCLDESARSIGKLAKLPDQSAPSTPALHPSGTLIAFALTGQSDPKRGFGSDIYTVNVDGSNLKALLLHEDNNVFYASPRFDASGNVVYVHRRSAIIQNGAYVGNDDGIERIDLRTGQRTRLLKDGADPSISPDGKMLALVHLKDGQIDGLWRADIDGSNAAPFLKTKDAFWYLQAPRFSPKSCQLILSAAGHTVSDAGSGAPYAMPRGPVAGPHEAHLSIPSELFLIPCDGSSVKSVGQTGDDVVPAWSPDGSKIAYVGTGGFFVLDVTTQTTRTVAQGQDFFFGDLVWLR